MVDQIARLQAENKRLKRRIESLEEALRALRKSINDTAERLIGEEHYDPRADPDQRLAEMLGRERQQRATGGRAKELREQEERLQDQAARREKRRDAAIQKRERNRQATRPRKDIGPE